MASHQPRSLGMTLEESNTEVGLSNLGELPEKFRTPQLKESMIASRIAMTATSYDNSESIHFTCLCPEVGHKESESATSLSCPLHMAFTNGT